MSHHRLHEIILRCKFASDLLWGIKTLKGSDKAHFIKKIDLSMSKDYSWKEGRWQLILSYPIPFKKNGL